MTSKAGLELRDQGLPPSAGEDDRPKPSLLPEFELKLADECWVAGRSSVPSDTERLESKFNREAILEGLEEGYM